MRLNVVGLLDRLFFDLRFTEIIGTPLYIWYFVGLFDCLFSDLGFDEINGPPL